MSNIEILLLAVRLRRSVTLKGNVLVLDGRLKSFFKNVARSHTEALKVVMRELESHPLPDDLVLECMSQISGCEQDAIAFRARLRESPISQAICNRLKNKVSAWKKREKSLGTDILEENDIKEIQTASRYYEFAELIFANEELFNEFALFSIRDRVPAEIFIQFPNLARKIVECNLSGRIGRANKNILIEWKGDEKIVTLPFEGKQVNILDEEQTVTLQSNYVITVGEMFEIFKNKTYEVGNLEYLRLGVTNWNAHKWATWNPVTQTHERINLHNPSWWWLLPILETATKQEIENRYGIALAKGEWCVSATATSLSKTLDYENTHAFMEIAIPHGDGKYHILDFGKLATVFPSSFLDAMSMFCDNLHATISFPDENIYYLHRARAYHSFAITEAQGKELMSLIRRDMVKGIEKNFVYQIESDNCAKWVHETLVAALGSQAVPDMFQMHLLETEPTSFVQYIFKAIKLLPEKWHTPVMIFFHLPLGAFRETWVYEQGKRVSKSLTNHEFWETGNIFLPALLLKLKETGALDFVEDLLQAIIEKITYQIRHKQFIRTVMRRRIWSFETPSIAKYAWVVNNPWNRL